MEEISESQETKAASVMGEREEPRLPWRERLPGNNGETSRQFARPEEQNKAEAVSMKGRFGRFQHTNAGGWKSRRKPGARPVFQEERGDT